MDINIEIMKLIIKNERQKKVYEKLDIFFIFLNLFGLFCLLFLLYFAFRIDRFSLIIGCILASIIFLFVLLYQFKDLKRTKLFWDKEEKILRAMLTSECQSCVSSPCRCQEDTKELQKMEAYYGVDL